jgi:ribosome biogenesis GTPase
MPPDNAEAAPLTARVIATHGRNSEIWPQSVDHPVEAMHRGKRIRLLCNDQVVVSENNDQWVVESILERRNVFERQDGRGRRQAIAANVDRLLITVAAEPAPSGELIERYLVAAGVLGLKASVIVNKDDLRRDEVFEARLQELRDAGFGVLITAAKHGKGIDELRAHIEGQTVLFVGQSGVGKSTLVNGLLGQDKQSTAAISILTGKGTHTTTTARAIPLPGLANTWLVDTPGVWEYSLWRLHSDDICLGFPEFERAEGHCRFRNCSHSHEPGCAIAAAVAAGMIPRARWEAYRAILEQNAKYTQEQQW